jgi:hypothetical protein
MPDGKPSQITLSPTMVQFGILIIGAICGAAYNAYNIAEKLATKPYVDERFDASKKYTDDKFSQALEKSDNNLNRAFEHSDQNFSKMRLIQEQQSSDIKSQGVKLDIILDKFDRTKHGR